MNETHSKDIELRSEKVRNIIGKIPPFLIRGGIGVVSFLFVCLFVAAYYIPYPENINANIILHTAPNHTAIIGTIHFPQKYRTRIKKGMEVKAELEGYPANKYGYITGEINEICSSIDENNTFIVEVTFPSRLKTQKAEIPYTSALRGQSHLLVSKNTFLQKIFIN